MAQKEQTSTQKNQYHSAAESVAVDTGPIQVQSLTPPPFQMKISSEVSELETQETQPSNYLMTTGAAASPNDSPSDSPNEANNEANNEVTQQKQVLSPFQIPIQKQETTQFKKIEPFQFKASQSSNNGMPEDLHGKMENAFQADFSNVNIHQNSKSATDVGALAYAQGNDVHFAPGQFKPETQSGQELIGHELAHVVQQREGRVKPTTQAGGMPVNDDKGLEGEADNMGRKAAAFQMKKDPNIENNYPENTQNSPNTSIQTKSAPIQMKAAPEADGGASGGNGQLDLGGTSTYFQTLGSSQPTDFIKSIKTAPSAIGQIYSQQQTQTKQSLPILEQPTGLPAKAPVEKEQSIGKETKEEGNSSEGETEGPQAENSAVTASDEPKTQQGASVPAAPLPNNDPVVSAAPTQVSPPASTTTVIGEETVDFSAGDRPKVDTSGDADAQKLQSDVSSSTSDVQQKVTKGNQDTKADFGENDIFPQVEPEMMEAQATFETGALPSIEELGEVPEMEAEVLAGFNAQAKQHLESQIAPQLEQHEAKKLETEASTQTEWTTYNQSVETETARITAEQEAQQNQAKTEIEVQREQWRQENEAVKQQFEQDAAAEKAKSKNQIDAKIVATNQEVESVYAKAESDAETKANDAETEAKAAEDDRSIWERAWDWLKDRFNDIVNGLKAAVNAIINMAKTLVTTIIDAAKNVVIGLISAFGEILKGLVDIAFAAFPEIRDRIKGAIDTVVTVATDVINSLADALKDIVTGLLDALGSALTFLLDAYQAFVNFIFDAIKFIAVGLYKIMKGINNLVKAARQSPEFFLGQLSEEILGTDVTKPLPNERPALVSNGQSASGIPNPDDMGMDSPVTAFMNKNSYSESDFVVEPIVSGEILSPEIIAQLQSMGDGEFEFGESNDEAHSMDAFNEELLGYPTEGMSEDTEIEGGAMEAATSSAVTDDEMVGPFASATERMGHIVNQMTEGVSKWWNENWGKIIIALAAGLLGFILLNVVTGGAVMAALPLLMQIVGAYFLGEAIVRMTSYIGDYLGSAWPGQIAIGATSLARGLAIGAFELVSSLLFGGKAAIRGMRNGVSTVARQGVRGAARTGARSVATSARNSVRNGVRTLGEVGGMARTGLGNTFRNGKAVITGVGRGFSRGARSMGDLGRRLARQFKFRKFKFSIRNRNWRLLGKMNPWILMANGRIQQVNANKLTTPNGKPPRVGDAATYADEAGNVNVRVISGRQRNFDVEIQTKLDAGDITPDEAIQLRNYNAVNPSASRNVDSVLGDVRNPQIELNPSTGRFANPNANLTRRQEYMGSTPSKHSGVGQKVKDKMRADGRFRENPITGKEEVFGKVKRPDGTVEDDWFDFADADMGHHPVDAVDYWNANTDLGPRHPDLINWMKDPENYEFEHFRFNRSKGGATGSRYEPPTN